jgi:hypothetical protein
VGKGAKRRAHQTRDDNSDVHRRVKIERGLSFFTLARAGRRSDLLVRHIERLESAI